MSTDPSNVAASSHARDLTVGAAATGPQGSAAGAVDRLVRMAATARGVPDDVIRLEVGLDPQEPRP